MKVNDIKIELNPTPEELAETVAHMSDKDQVRFINKLGDVAKTCKNGYGLGMQLQYMKDCDTKLTSNGKWFIETFIDYFQ